jgi:hypothetical protein
MAKNISLSQGYSTVVDDEDFDRLSTFKWFAILRKRKDGVVTSIYAARKAVNEQGVRTTLYMHREILGLGFGRVPEVDHKDNNGLNNQRTNFRVTTRSCNTANTRLRIDNKSSRKGVWWHEKNRKWLTQIGVNNKTIHIGYFNSLEEASAAHDEAARKYFGEFAKETIPIA